jgi:hypothetical protein
MARFGITPMNVSRAVIVGLRRRGVDVGRARANKLGASDEGIWHCISRGRVLFTHDADFLRLASSGFTMPGLCMRLSLLLWARPFVD